MGGGAFDALPGKLRFWGSRSLMARALFRTFLSLVLVLTLGVQSASAQSTCPPSTNFCPPSTPNAPPARDSHNNTVWYVVGGIAAAALGAFIAWRLFPDPERGLPPEQPPTGDPPPVMPVNLPPPGGG